MFGFINNHHDFIFNILPDYLHNKWIVMIFHIIFFVIVIKLTNLFLEKFLNKITKHKEDLEVKKQLYTLKSVVKSVVDTVIVAFAFMYILNWLGVDIRPILTAAGVLGVAIGFGAKRFFEDIITGMSIIMEGQVRVGDYIEINEHQGVVEKVDIRLIRLRDVQGRVHYIRNSMVDTIINHTRDYSYFMFDLGVAYSSDIDYVMHVLKETDENFRQNSEMKEFILEPLEILGLDKFDESAIVIKGRIKVVPMKQWRVGWAFNKEIKRVFEEKNIEIPFPQRTVHVIEKPKE